MAAEDEPLHAVERRERQPDPRAAITVAPALDDASDARLAVEPQAELRGLERHDEALADLHGVIGRDEHPVREMSSARSR